jgi:predicted RNA-binding protein YlqC (UPF0109 family)
MKRGDRNRERNGEGTPPPDGAGEHSNAPARLAAPTLIWSFFASAAIIRATQSRACVKRVPSYSTRSGMSEECPQSQVGELIANIARTLVDHPDQVSVEEIVGSLGSTLRLTVASRDFGKLIGNERRTERWLRKVLGEISVKHRRLYSLEIVGGYDVDPNIVIKKRREVSSPASTSSSSTRHRQLVP